MTKAQIRNVICQRLVAIRGSCNSYHIAHNDGVLRGLIWALNGRDPGTELTANVPHLLGIAGIPWRWSRSDSGEVEFDYEEEKP